MQNLPTELIGVRLKYSCLTRPGDIHVDEIFLMSDDLVKEIEKAYELYKKHLNDFNIEGWVIFGHYHMWLDVYSMIEDVTDGGIDRPIADYMDNNIDQYSEEYINSHPELYK